MAFVNVQLAISELPAVEDIEMEAMAPEYQREVRAQQFMVFTPVIIASFVPFLLVQKPFLLVIPAVVLLISLLIGWLMIKASKVKGVAVRNHDIAYRHGLYRQKTVVLAFNRIQHVEVSSGPLQRRYGLATLKFFTAGGSSVDLKVDGLNRERAEQIRAFVLGKNTTDHQ